MVCSQASAADMAAKVVMGDGGSVTVAEAAGQLDALIAAEDPFCGESVVRLLIKPLVDLPSEAAELQSWAI